MKSKWKWVRGWRGYYKVSNHGQVKSCDRYVKTRGNGKRLVKGKILKGSLSDNGYLIVGLYRNRKMKNKLVHRLVARAFIPNPENKPEVNHEDGNKLNNCVGNLSWMTEKENQQHSLKIGLRAKGVEWHRRRTA